MIKCYEIALIANEKDETLDYNNISLTAPVILLKQYEKNTISRAGIKVQNLDDIDITNKSFYRYPKLTLPRNKTDLLKEKYNIKLVRDENGADYKVISDAYVNSILFYNYRSKVIAYKFLNFLKENESSVSKSLIDLISKLEPEAYIILNNKIGWHSTPIKATFYYNMPYEENHNIRHINNVNAFLNLMNSTNLVLDVELASKCNEDSVVLDENDYESIMTMVNSADKLNHAMALELMSNCNIEKSLDIICLVYCNQFNVLKEASNWNSVNVKALRKRLKYFTPYSISSYYNVNYFDYFFKELAKENMLTEFAFKVMSKKMMEETMAGMGFTADSVFDFSVKDIKLKPKFLDKLKSKYEQRVVLDIYQL